MDFVNIFIFNIIIWSHKFFLFLSHLTVHVLLQFHGLFTLRIVTYIYVYIFLFWGAMCSISVYVLVQDSVLVTYLWAVLSNICFTQLKNCFWVIAAKHFFPFYFIGKAIYSILSLVFLFFVDHSATLFCNHQRPVFAFWTQFHAWSMTDYTSTHLNETGNTCWISVSIEHPIYSAYQLWSLIELHPLSSFPWVEVLSTNLQMFSGFVCLLFYYFF